MVSRKDAGRCRQYHRPGSAAATSRSKPWGPVTSGRLIGSGTSGSYGPSMSSSVENRTAYSGVRASDCGGDVILPQIAARLGRSRLGVRRTSSIGSAAGAASRSRRSETSTSRLRTRVHGALDRGQVKVGRGSPSPPGGLPHPTGCDDRVRSVSAEYTVSLRGGSAGGVPMSVREREPRVSAT